MSSLSCLSASIITSLLLFQSLNCLATHSVGADIQFEHKGNANYEIKLSFYRDCNGISAPNNPTIQIQSPSGCGSSFSTNLSFISMQEVSTICPSQLQQSSCNGGSLQGVEQYIYSAEIQLPASCSDWIISYQVCCRNSAITNISNPSSNTLYVETQINNTLDQPNNSVVFSSAPVYYICANAQFMYNHGASDPDGDSLSFTMITPRSNYTSNVSFISGYSANSPINTHSGFHLDPQTGQLSFSPTSGQIGVMAIQINEYRQGQLIGHSIRDMQVVVIQCQNQYPSVSDLTIQSGALTISPNIIHACEGNHIQFQIQVSDQDLSNQLSVSHTIQQQLPGANVIFNGGNPGTMTIDWTLPSNADPIYNFTVTCQDNACPIVGTSVKGYQIQTTSIQLPFQDSIVCPEDTITTLLDIYTSTAGSYQWSPTQGLDDPTLAKPTATISGSQSYQVIFTDSMYGCQSTRQVNFTEHDIQLLPDAIHVEYCQGDNPVQLGALLMVNGENTFPTVNHQCILPDMQSQQDGGSHLLQFTGVIDDATQNAILSFCFRGDFGSATSEYITILGEDGTTLGQVSKNDGNSTYGDCGTNPICVSLQIPLHQWNQWNNNDTVLMTLQTSSAVNSICSGLSSMISQIEVTYEKYDPSAYTWTPALGLNDSLHQNPFASPSSNTTYTCQASDGRCIVEADVDVICTNLSTKCHSMKLGRTQEGNQLTWEHTDHHSESFYQIERSQNGIIFEIIDTIQHASSSIYHYTDKTANISSTLYYRVGHVSSDDIVSYNCPIQHIDGVKEYNLTDIYPNPFSSQLHIRLNNSRAQTNIRILDIRGVCLEHLIVMDVDVELDLSHLVSGRYFIRMESTDGSVAETIQVVKL